MHRRGVNVRVAGRVCSHGDRTSGIESERRTPPKRPSPAAPKRPPTRPSSAAPKRPSSAAPKRPRLTGKAYLDETTEPLTCPVRVSIQLLPPRPPTPRSRPDRVCLATAQGRRGWPWPAPLSRRRRVRAERAVEVPGQRLYESAMRSANKQKQASND